MPKLGIELNYYNTIFIFIPYKIVYMYMCVCNGIIIMSSSHSKALFTSEPNLKTL